MLTISPVTRTSHAPSPQSLLAKRRRARGVTTIIMFLLFTSSFLTSICHESDKKPAWRDIVHPKLPDSLARNMLIENNAFWPHPYQQLARHSVALAICLRLLLTHVSASYARCPIDELAQLL